MVTRNLPLFIAFAGMALLAACGGSSSGGNNGGGGAAGGGGGGGGGAGAGGGGGAPATEAVTVSLGDAIKNVTVQPNVATQFSISYSLDPNLLSEPVTAYKAITVNLEDTMPSVQITSTAVADNEEPDLLDPYRILFRLARHIPLQTLLGIGDAYANTQGTVTVYISYEGDPDACVNGYALGSYNFTGDVDAQPASETGVATTEGMSPAIHLVSTGSFGLCVEISPVPIPMPAFVTIPEIAVEAEPCDLDPLPDAELVGDWAGTYSCTNKNSPTEGGSISLNISKNTDGTFTYVDDGGASYTGHFCGPEFRYSGGVPGDYTESGKFIVQSGGSAFKESTWNSIPAGFDAGTCTDDLTKQ